MTEFYFNFCVHPRKFQFSLNAINKKKHAFVCILNFVFRFKAKIHVRAFENSFW